VFEATVVGFSPSFGVAPEVLDTIDVNPAINEILLVADALVVEAVDLQFLINPPAVGVSV